MKILDYLYSLYAFVFEATLKRFFTIMLLCNFFVIVYAICLRYYIYNIVFLKISYTNFQLAFIYLIVFTGLISLYLRTLITFSITVVNTGHILNTQIPDMPESGGNRGNSIFAYDKSVHHHEHIHNHPPTPPPSTG